MEAMSTRWRSTMVDIRSMGLYLATTRGLITVLLCKARGLSACTCYTRLDTYSATTTNNLPANDRMKIRRVKPQLHDEDQELEGEDEGVDMSDVSGSGSDNDEEEEEEEDDDEGAVSSLAVLNIS